MINQPTRQNMPLLLWICVAVFTTFSACGLLDSKDKPEPLEPGPRNYEWTVDTLHSPPGGFIFDIWGSSPEDVWAVAVGGINNLWHFDGENWSVWPERVGSSFLSIHGFAPDNVWMGGNDGKIYHFDGKKWSLSFQYEVEGMRGADIRSIWGNSPTDIYVAGNIQPEEGPPFESFLLYYDGNRWNELLLTDFGVLFQRIRSIGSSAFLQARDRDHSPALSQFYRYKNSNLEQLFSAPTREVTWTSLNKIGEDIFYVIGDTLYTYNNSRFKKELAVTEPNFSYQIHGRSKKDLFFGMEDRIEHFNGNNFQLMIMIDRPHMSFSDNSMIFEQDVFFIVHDFRSGTNYIYHGTLND